jgi:catechol 2,3-dioxygenase-like lactoylglutathione lyase family enzyme
MGRAIGRKDEMVQVCRLGHATFTTPDLEKQTDYWSTVIGLQIVDRGRDWALFATKLGHEAILLERGDEPRLTRMALQARPDTDLAAAKAELEQKGLAVERRKDVTPGVSDALVFQDPNGVSIELHAAYKFHPVDASEAGVGPLKFGHVAHRVQDVDKVVSFYVDALGFRVSDWIGDHFAFLRCGVDHHTLNFVQYTEPRLHHIAFEVKDWAELQRGVEILRKHGVQLVWGPLRHVVGHNVAAYHRNSDDVRVELFCEMDQMKDETLGYWEPRPWHEETPLYPKRWPKDTLRSAWGFGSFGVFPGYP